MDDPSVRLHNEILQNRLTLKTGYLEIASRLGFGINLVTMQLNTEWLKETSILQDFLY
jgi:hypothetical protein